LLPIYPNVLHRDLANTRPRHAPFIIDIMMRYPYHHDMRTTLTLDDDVAARLQAEARQSGRPFKVVVNEHLRASLSQRKAAKRVPVFQVVPRALGGPQPGLSYDDVGGMLDQLEGAHRR
jgi:hypothetical protein